MNIDNWFKDWFGSELYLQVYKHRDNSEAESFIKFLILDLQLNPNQTVLDAACGAGRHVSYLHNLGYKVFGFDLSLTLLKLAKNNSIDLNLINADIRDVSFKNQFDVILNLFTSFGYFNSDEDNFRFFKNAKTFLKREGLIVFDYLNDNYLRKNLVFESFSKINDFEIFETRNIEDNRVIKNIKIINKDSEKNFLESVKLFSYKQIVSQFSSLGFKIFKEFGDYSGGNFDLINSKRLILVLKNE